MIPDPDEIKEWLLLAEKDLISAQVLLAHELPVIETSCFHSQQAIEKALKAFLVWKCQSFEKIHDIAYLLDLCKKYGLSFDFFNKDKAETITSYAAEIRYPFAGPKITMDKAREALDIANNIWRFVSDQISILQSKNKEQ